MSGTVSQVRRLLLLLLLARSRPPLLCAIALWHGVHMHMPPAANELGLLKAKYTCYFPCSAGPARLWSPSHFHVSMCSCGFWRWRLVERS